MANEGGLRRHNRVGERVPAQVMWKDKSGTERLLNGFALDVSEDGVRFELKEKIEEGTFVNFRVERLKLHGTGSVRWCTRKQSKYEIGLQFTGGLKWKAAGMPKQN